MFVPGLIFKDESGKYYITYNNYLVLPSEVRKIISDLSEYCESYTDEEIIRINKETDPYKINYQKKNVTRRNKGYVYIFQCADKYKIGFTENVNRRLRQLDTRPFKLIQIFVSDLCVNAFDIEQTIHEKFKEFQVDNEWYSNSLPVESVIEYIKTAEGY